MLLFVMLCTDALPAGAIATKAEADPFGLDLELLSEPEGGWSEVDMCSEHTASRVGLTSVGCGVRERD